MESGRTVQIERPGISKCHAPCLGGLREVKLFMSNSYWLVESVIDGKSEGWWAQPPKGIGGWLTEDPRLARRYTKSEAECVAAALSYFPTPFRWSNWVATEHVSIDAAMSPGSEGNCQVILDSSEGQGSGPLPGCNVTVVQEPGKTKFITEPKPETEASRG
jgi:hypothetical protein